MPKVGRQLWVNGYEGEVNPAPSFSCIEVVSSLYCRTQQSQAECIDIILHIDCNRIGKIAVLANIHLSILQLRS